MYVCCMYDVVMLYAVTTAEQQINRKLPIAVDDKPSTPMSVMKQHFLSQFLKLLPQGIIDEDKMTLVGTGGFARVYVAEVRRHCSNLP